MKIITIKAPASSKPRIRQVMLNSGRVAYIAYREIMGCLIHSTACLTPERSCGHLKAMSDMMGSYLGSYRTPYLRQQTVALQLQHIDQFDPWYIPKFEYDGMTIKAVQP